MVNVNGLIINKRIRWIFLIILTTLLVVVFLLTFLAVLPGGSSASVPSGQLAASQIVVGNDHSCTIANDGWVYCWGKNDYGELGDNSTNNASTPVRLQRGAIPAGATIEQLTAGDYHTCAIASDKQAYCWGGNNHGQIGDGSTTDRLVPVAVSQGALPSGSSIRDLTAGEYHTCAIASNNKAYCWGYNNDGQIGDNTTTDRSAPTAVNQGGLPSGALVNQISAGGFHTCAIASNDSWVYCWGSNVNGQLGDNTTTMRTAPELTLQGSIPAGTQIRQVSSGVSHACVVGSNNLPYCWGANDYSQLGDNTTTQRNTPVAVSQGGLPSGRMVNQIVAGGVHSCAIASDNKSYCWGLNDSGQIGDGTSTTRATPVAVSQGGLPSGVTANQIANRGGGHTCITGSDNQSYCWGYNAHGNLGNGTTANATSPVQVNPIIAPILSQSVYRLYQPSTATTPGQPLATTDTPATLDGIADPFRMRLGLTNEMRSKPMVTSIDSGAYSSCATNSDDWAYCWGEGWAGQLGNGDTVDSSMPVAISQGAIPSGATIRQLSAGLRHVCVIASDNWVYCWGENNRGQLGDNSVDRRNTPVALNRGNIPTGATIREITTGAEHTCAIASNNRAYCWGNNDDGQVGDGTNTARTTPVVVSQGAMPSGALVNQISAAKSGWHTCATSINERAYCWGNNWHGSLGNNSTTNRNTPVAVSQGAMPSGSVVRQIALGQEHTCAIASDQKAYCWGHNNEGQVGDNSSKDRSTPVAVNQGAMPSGAMVNRIAPSQYAHTCAIANDNKVYCWGRNSVGHLGDGTTVTPKRTPVAVVQGSMPSNWSAFDLTTSAVGTCMIANDSLAYCWGWNNNSQLGNGNTTNSSSPVTVLPGEMTNNTSLLSAGVLSIGIELAPKGVNPTCSSISSGWQAVTSTSDVAFGGYPPAHGSAIGGFADDPIMPTIFGFRHQTIVGQSPLSNVLSISPGQTGLWDIVLRDRSSQVSTTYCMRAVLTGGSASMVNYGVFPEITTSLGSMDVSFVDGSGNTLSGSATDTVFPSKLIMTSQQTSTAVFTNSSTKRLSVRNSQSKTGWTVSLAATGGGSAIWQSGVNNYSYNSAPTTGQLTVRMSDSSAVPEGEDPLGNLCTNTGISLSSTDTAFEAGSVNAISLMSGSPASGFNCYWRIRDIGLAQTIPASQPSGSYSLDLTATIVAN